MPHRPVTLITGASSGIGEALADLLATAGHDLVLVARRQDRLENAASRLRARGASVEVFVADLADEAGLNRAITRAGQNDIDLLINNAGAGGYAPLATVSPAEVNRLWTLNATAPLLLTRAVLPHLIARGSGGVITIASLLAFSAGQDAPYLPSRTIYASAKAAGVALSRTLNTELASTGVQATLVCPGRVQTEFSNGAARNDPRAMSAQDVAAATWTAYRQGNAVCIPALGNPDVLDGLSAAERALLEGGNRPGLPGR
jgi:short-subunit dehydrogenase